MCQAAEVKVKRLCDEEVCDKSGEEERGKGPRGSLGEGSVIRISMRDR